MMLQKESTRRALRTALQLLLSMPVMLPVLLAALPGELKDRAVPLAAGFIAAGTAATKIYLTLEAKGMLPAWLHISPHNPPQPGDVPDDNVEPPVVVSDADVPPAPPVDPAEPLPRPTDNGPKPEDPGQSNVSQDPNADLEDGPMIEDLGNKR